MYSDPCFFFADRRALLVPYDPRSRGVCQEKCACPFWLDSTWILLDYDYQSLWVVGGLAG